MRYLRLLFLVALCVCFISCSQAVDVAAEKEKVQNEVNKLVGAINDKDWDSFAASCSEDWVHATHMGTRWSMDEMQAFFAEHISNHTTAITNVGVDVSGDGSMAWVTFDEQTEYHFDGNPVSETAIFTAVYEKEGYDWKMKVLHRTVTAAPPETSEK